MLKRIAGTGLIVLLVGALIGGGAYILLRSDGEGGGAAYGGRGREAASGELSQPNGQQGQNTDAGGYGGYGRQGQGGTTDSAALPAEAWQTVDGIVVEAEDEIVLDTAEGKISFHLGPERYREDQTYLPQEGDPVRLSGFWEDETFEAASIENLDTGRTLTLRDQTGRPLWAGRGRGQQ